MRILDMKSFLTTKTHYLVPRKYHVYNKARPYRVPIFILYMDMWWRHLIFKIMILHISATGPIHRENALISSIPNLFPIQERGLNRMQTNERVPNVPILKRLLRSIKYKTAKKKPESKTVKRKGETDGQNDWLDMQYVAATSKNRIMHAQLRVVELWVVIHHCVYFVLSDFMFASESFVGLFDVSLVAPTHPLSNTGKELHAYCIWCRILMFRCCEWKMELDWISSWSLSFHVCCQLSLLKKLLIFPSRWQCPFIDHQR